MKSVQPLSHQKKSSSELQSYLEMIAKSKEGLSSTSGDIGDYQKTDVSARTLKNDESLSRTNPALTPPIKSFAVKISDKYGNVIGVVAAIIAIIGALIATVWFIAGMYNGIENNTENILENTGKIDVLEQKNINNEKNIEKILFYFDKTSNTLVTPTSSPSK